MSREAEVRARELTQQLRASTMAFLRSRLDERESVEWALDLDAGHVEERDAVRELVTTQNMDIAEPYRSAWCWILESWSAKSERGQDSEFLIRQRVAKYGLDGDTLRQVVDLIRPWPMPKLLEDWRLYGGREPPKVPKRLSDLVSVSMQGSDLVTLKELGLDDLKDAGLVRELVDRLEAALLDGLHVADRLGWFSDGVDMTRHDVRRVYHVPRSGAGDNEEPDPDTYRHGLAANTKLLFEAVELLSERDLAAARRRVARWRHGDWTLLRRLWAGLARNGRLADSEEVAGFSLGLADEEFWKPIDYPEFSELRARRFGDLSEESKAAVESRIMEMPPASFWRRRGKEEEVKRYRHDIASVELRRILAAGWEISEHAQGWLDDVAAKYDVTEVKLVDHDFEPTSLVDWISDEGEPFAIGDVRSEIDKLEDAFGKERWDGSATAAQNYLRKNMADVLKVLSDSPALSAKCPGIWREVLLAQRPVSESKGAAPAEVAEGKRRAAEARARASTVLGALKRLPDSALRAIVDRLADWMAAWAGALGIESEFSTLWLRIWPLAIEATNSRRHSEEDDVSELLGEREPNRGERLAAQALNTPAGILMTAFLNICPNRTKVPHPFADGKLRDMRAAAIGATGQAKLQVLHRLLMGLEYMRRTDPDWTDQYLLGPLMNVDGSEVEIWDAIARTSVLGFETMSAIGQRMAEVSHADALPEDTRARLGERVVYRVLLDKNDNRPTPSVPDSDVQQMLRLGTDRLRSTAGRIVGVFVQSKDRATMPEQRFRRIVKPFLETVWPKERALTSRSLSDKFAELPAMAGAAFAEAVDVVERFMTPFDCWSLHDYGLYGNDVDGKKLRQPTGKAEAAALLKLLDVSIGSEENVIRPLDLDKALVAIRDVEPKLARDPRYARLTALVRR